MRKMKERLESKWFVGDSNTTIKIIYDRIIINQITSIDDNVAPFTRSISIDMKDCEINENGEFIYNEYLRPVNGGPVTHFEPQTLFQYMCKYIPRGERFVEMDENGKRITPIFLFFDEMVNAIINYCTEEIDE